MPVFLTLCSTGPSQNLVGLQQPSGAGYSMTQQPNYSPMQTKTASPPGPGLYPSGPYQPVPPASSYQPGPPPTSYLSPQSQPLLTRPSMGGPVSHTPPQSASPSPGPRMYPSQATPPPPAPVSSSSYYPNQQQPQPMAPAWQYNTAPPPMGTPTSMSSPSRGPLGSHMNPATGSTVPPPPSSAAAYSSLPPPSVSHGATQPLGQTVPPPSVHGFFQQGKNTKF